MLNENESVPLLNQLSNYAIHDNDKRTSILVEQQEYNLVATLRPKIYKDGNAWCVLYGENIHAGVCGFGETPYKAVLAFNKSWGQK